MILKEMEKFIEFVCSLRAVQLETTPSEILLKKRVFIFCTFIKLRCDPHLRQYWTVFPLTSSSRTWLYYCTPHSSRLILRLQALNLLFRSLLDLQYGGHQNSWPWSCQYTVSGQDGEQDHITGLVDAVHYEYPELQQVIPESTKQGSKPF